MKLIDILMTLSGDTYIKLIIKIQGIEFRTNRFPARDFVGTPEFIINSEERKLAENKAIEKMEINNNTLEITLG